MSKYTLFFLSFLIALLWGCGNSEQKYTKGISPAWATKTNIGLTTPTSCSVVPKEKKWL